MVTRRLRPGQLVVGAGLIPPPLAVRPELADGDVEWLNAQLALLDDPPVQYANRLPTPRSECRE